MVRIIYPFPTEKLGLWLLSRPLGSVFLNLAQLEMTNSAEFMHFRCPSSFADLPFFFPNLINEEPGIFQSSPNFLCSIPR